MKSYREQPNAHAAASRQAKVDIRTARRAWRKGWDNPEWARRGIQDLLEDERLSVRDRLVRDEEKQAQAATKLRTQRQRAKLDAIEERAKEAQAVRAAMANAMGLLGMSAQLAQGAAPLIQQAARKRASEGDMEWKEAVKLTSQLSNIGLRASTIMKTSMEMLRLHTGDPQQIIGVAGMEQSHQVDAAATAQAMGGEEVLKKAINDLLDGNMTDEAQRLVEVQAERLQGQSFVH